jgi:hypothetical protein
MEDQKRTKIEEKLRQLISTGIQNSEQGPQSDYPKSSPFKVIRRRKGKPDTKIS